MKTYYAIGGLIFVVAGMLAVGYACFFTGMINAGYASMLDFPYGLMIKSFTITAWIGGIGAILIGIIFLYASSALRNQ